MHLVNKLHAMIIGPGQYQRPGQFEDSTKKVDQEGRSTSCKFVNATEIT